MRKLLSIILSLTIMITLCSCVITDNNIENYADDVEKYHAELFMPNLDDLGNYENREYFIKKDEGIFPSYSMQLLVKYDSETFLKEKEQLETAYTYLDKPQKADWKTDYTIPLEKFSYEGFDFKVVQFEDTEYPKNFGIVGVSESKKEIVYLWLYAPDLDLICKTDENQLEEMIEFLDCYFSLD